MQKKKKRELNAQATGTMAKSGGRKSGVCRKQMYVGICMSLNGSSAPSVQHRMKQAQETYRKRHKVLCCPYITLKTNWSSTHKSCEPRPPLIPTRQQKTVSRLNSACKFLVKG